MGTTRMSGLALLLVVLPSGCSSSAPLAADRLPVQVESVQVLQLESFPVQLMLHVEGWLPNPCSTTGWEVKEGPAGEIRVELYAVPDGSEACIQVLAPFEANIPLGAQPAGDFRIVLNGNDIGLAN